MKQVHVHSMAATGLRWAVNMEKLGISEKMMIGCKEGVGIDRMPT
jgi:hypothetical protein